MTPEQANRAVADRARVRLRTRPGDTHAEGRIISYSLVPTVLIETDDGERISWRHDLAELVTPRPELSPERARQLLDGPKPAPWQWPDDSRGVF